MRSMPPQWPGVSHPRVGPLLYPCDYAIEQVTWHHRFVRLGLVQTPIATDVLSLGLAIDEVLQHLALVRGKLLGGLGKGCLELRVLVLLGQLFGPVACHPIMASPVVDLL